MKYDSVRVKHKHLILISQHHWSPTASHHPLLHPAPPAHLHPYAFHPCCFWKFLKNWKEEGDDMHRKHMFSEICNENCFSTETHRGFVLDSEQKSNTQLQTIWP